MSTPRINRVVGNFTADATRNRKVQLKELRGKRLVTAELPPFGGPGTEELWRTTLEGVRALGRRLTGVPTCLLRQVGGRAEAEIASPCTWRPPTARR